MPLQDDTTDNSSTTKRAFDLIDLIGSRLPMGSRKKSKTHVPKQDDAQSQSQSTSTTRDSNGETVTAGSSEVKAGETNKDKDGSNPIAFKEPRTPKAKAASQGWYGSWKNKAVPVTEVRRESISASPRPKLNGGTPRKSQKLDSNDSGSASPHKYMSTGSIRSTKAIPLVATTTNVSITSGKSVRDGNENSNGTAVKEVDPPLPPDPADQENGVRTNEPEISQIKPVSDTKTPDQSSAVGWLGGWWSRPDGYDDSSNKKADEDNAIVEEAKNKPLPATTPDPPTDQPAESTNDSITIHGDSQTKPNLAKEITTTEPKSWFSFWSTSQNAQILASPDDQPKSDPNSNTSRPATLVTKLATDPTDSDSKSIRSINATIKSVKDIGARKASGWAFWSGGSTDVTSPMEADGTSKQIGQLAVANTPSQSHPEQAQFNSSAVEETPPEPSKPVKTSTSRTPNKAVNPKKRSVPKKDVEPVSTPADPAVNKPPTKVPESSDATSALLKLDSHKQDIILPEFKKTYSMLQKQTMLQNLRQYFLGDGPQDHPHLHLVNNPPRIKKALAIGVHGFFPNSLFQKVLGAPTGTSIKFSNMAAAAIKNWTESQGYECEIEKAALEGEGLIADRVDTLWKLLLNWIDHVRSADFVLFACHSQGVPVTVMLVDRLIKFGILSSNKIGICAMAGINLGPWKEYKTQLLGRSALELFDFATPSSRVSESYRAALEQVLRFNVRITFVGSLDDQLVSLESSTFSNISHPCIYRAVFIDGRYYTSDFITELCGFALKLRNLGLSDHGLIRELSPALAGSLYSGEGHSRLYEHLDVYSLAVSHALETTSPPPGTSVTIRNYEGPPGAKDSNPYFLPWAMRGILEEEKVRKELADECEHLLNLFDSWKPTTKLLKDVRFRLEALKSKL